MAVKGCGELSATGETMIPVTSRIPLGAVLLDDGGLVTVVEPDEHIVRAIDGRLVCVRPAHEGMACRVELAA